jgi:hypothetical protein
MPPGGTFAVISGDPLEAGPFVMRVRLPPGYMLPPYRRPKEEQLIVLAGAITVGTCGESGTIDTRKLTAGRVRVAAGKRAAFCAYAGRRHRADRRHWAVRGDSNMSQHSELSYVSGVGTQPLLGETIGACFDRIVDRFGEREALVVRHQNIRWTYRELQRRTNNLAVRCCGLASILASASASGHRTTLSGC